MRCRVPLRPLARRAAFAAALFLLPALALSSPAEPEAPLPQEASPQLFSTTVEKIKAAYLEDRGLGEAVSPDELAALDRLAETAPRVWIPLQKYLKARSVFEKAVEVQVGRGQEEPEKRFLEKMASVEAGLDLTPEQAHKAVELYGRRTAFVTPEIRAAADVLAREREAVDKKLKDPNLPPKERAALTDKSRKIAAWFDAQSRKPGGEMLASAGAVGAFYGGKGPSAPDLIALNSTPRARSWVNSQMKNVPAPRLTEEEREASVILRTPGGADTWYRPQPQDFIFDPKLSHEIKRIWVMAEKKAADPAYRNETYGWLYDATTKRAKIAQAAHDIIMDYRYGGSEAQYNKDFGTDLTPAQVADLDHFYAAASYGSVPILGPIVCGGASAVYDGIVSPMRKKFRNYTYDLKQVGTDIQGCLFGMTLAVPSGQ